MAHVTAMTYLMLMGRDQEQREDREGEEEDMMGRKERKESGEMVECRGSGKWNGRRREGMGMNERD